MQPQEPPHELPEVELPSAEFIVRLFVIPALIVVGIVGLWLAMGALGGDRADALTFARRIREDRGGWRAAFALANRLRSDAATASDPRLLGELTDLLDAELDRGAEPRMAEYLALAVGAFQTEHAELADGRPVDPIATLARGLDARRDPAVRVASAASLARHAARLEGRLDDPGTIGALAAASRAADVPELRRVAAFALSFCGGGGTSDVLRERLHDDPDRYVRDNAALALARCGDPTAADALRAMLSTDEDPAGLGETVRLQALAALARPAAVALLRDVRPQVEALASTTDGPVRDEARSLLQKIQSTPGL